MYLSRVARVVSPLNVARVYDDDDDDDDDAKRIRRACCATKLDFFFFSFFPFPPIRCRTCIYRVRFRLSERAITEPGSTVTSEHAGN